MSPIFKNDREFSGARKEMKRKDRKAGEWGKVKPKTGGKQHIKQAEEKRF